MEWIIVILSVVCCTLAVLLKFSLSREKILEESNKGYENYFVDLQAGLSYVLREITSIDIRGAFDSDDEVGDVFTAIKNMIKSLNTFLIEGSNAKIEK